MKDQDFNQLLDRFFENDMTEKELIAFRDLLRSDPNLANEFRIALALHRSIKAKQFEEKYHVHLYPHNRTIRQVPFWKRPSFLGWALAAMVLLLLGFWHLQPTTPAYNSQELLATYYRPPVFISEDVRSTKENADLKTLNEWEAAKKFFSMANFSEAYEQLRKSPARPDESAYLQKKLMQAVCLHEMGDSKAGLAVLVPIINHHAASAEIRWYAALLYLANGQAEPAKEQLTQLEGTGYGRNAKELLLEIEAHH